MSPETRKPRARKSTVAKLTMRASRLKPDGKKCQFGFDCSPAWFDWLGRLAIHGRLSKSSVIDQAVVLYARSTGFTEPPPLR